MELTQIDLKELLDYREGNLYWKKSRSGIKNITDPAGCLAKHINCNGVDRYYITVNHKTYLTARLIFLWHYGYLLIVVDHIDRNPLNNKIENLRAADKSSNMKNRTSALNSSSKYLGVRLNEGKYWVARINLNKKTKTLGSFKTEREAALAYNEAAIKYHGEFANPNIIL